MLLLDGQVHHDTHAIPMGNYVIGVGNYVIATPSKLGNYKIADIRAELPSSVVSAADRSISAGRDMAIRASDGAVAAAGIYGSSVTTISHMEYHRPAVSGQPVRLADPPPLLAGRDELLAELDARLTGGDGRQPLVVVLCGLAGAGKTSVALEYAHRHRAEVGLAWQLAAEEAAVTAAGFGELAAQLGALDPLDPRNPVASAHGVLAVYPDEWLLMFDNALDRASVELFLPPAGRGRVLITSQNQNWPHGQALEVPVLDTEVATEFLVKRSRDPDHATARELADELGGLPLALEQAAAYTYATGGTLAGYLGLFRERRADLLARGEPAGYRGTVATTWAVAFTRLEEDAPGAAGLLRLMACLAPELIPLNLLLQTRDGLPGQLSEQVRPVLGPLLGDPIAAGDAIAALRLHSLINPVVRGVASVHRLVQAVMIDQMPSELAEAWRQAAAAVIEAALPNDPE